MLRLSVLFASLMFTWLASSPTRADWPMARHDARRSGVASGTSNITDPVAYYRYYLGGSLGAAGMLTFDVDADGEQDIIMITGGRVIARSVSDEDLWSSPPRGFRGLVGLADLNGDTQYELVVRSQNQVFALDPRTGEQLWEEPLGEMGTIGGTRLADFDNDGSVDLLIVECACCGVNSGYPGAIYTFTDGFASARHMFELPDALCGQQRSITVVDVDGVAPPELLLPSAEGMRIFSPSTGAMLAEVTGLGPRAYWNRCWTGQFDTEPGDELACVFLENNSAVIDRWRLTVFDYTPGSLAVLWTEVLAPDATGDVRVLDPVADLDGDGAFEIIVSVAISGIWETRIYDALSGVREDTLADAIAFGQLQTAAGLQLVTRSTTSLHGWTFAGTTATPAWVLPGHSAFTGWSFARAWERSQPQELMTIDLDGDGDQDLLTSATTTDSSRIVAYAIDGSTTTELGEYPLRPGTDAQAAWLIPPVTATDAILAISYSDGFMIIHDESLQPAVAGGEFDLAILRTGGYYAAGGWRDLRRSPVLGSLETGAPDAILIPDARGALLRLDGSSASWASGPALRWERLYTTAPSIIDGLVDGGRGVSCVAVRDPRAESAEHNIAVLEPDGTVRWQTPAEATPLLDVVGATLDGDAITDLVFHWGSPSDTMLRTRGISGADGSTLWSSVPIETGAGRQPAGLAIAPFDGDAIDDVYFQGGATRVLSGVDGVEIASAPGPSYFLPTLANLDADPALEVVLHGGNRPVNVIEDDLSGAILTSAEDDSPFPYGSVVTCAADRSVLVSGSWEYRSRLKITDLNGAAVGTEQPVFLAGGLRFSSQAELDAASVFGGQLTSVGVHENLAGDGSPAALVGSTDGWLYWIDPCDGSLVESVDFGVAVGQPVFGDTDGDGFDEVIVSAADGYLYGMKHRTVRRPTDVRDIDPADPSSTDDADFITTVDTWIARWDAVAGADSYEVGLFADDDGTPVLSPTWQDAGTELTITLSGLSLVSDARYFFSVRAVVATGPSVDAVSDGALVRSPPVIPDGGTVPDGGVVPGTDAGPGTPPDDGGCGCRVVESRGGSAWIFLFAALAWLVRRRAK